MSPTNRIAFGDFQTPPALAERIAVFLQEQGIAPTMIVEPTCGAGSFVQASIRAFGRAPSYYAFDINPGYVERVQTEIGQHAEQMTIACQNFFESDWAGFFANATAERILVIGNPPWVTNSRLGALEQANLPRKTNHQGLKGLDAKTGAANFDIAESMLITLLESLQAHTACLAMLCKMATARKVLRHAWKNRLNLCRAALYKIDAKMHFQASVEACLLVAHLERGRQTTEAAFYAGLDCSDKAATLAFRHNALIADADSYRHVRDIEGASGYVWRSGVKHDAVNVMELTKTGSAYRNALGESVQLEEECIFPLLKPSDLSHGRSEPRRYVLLTQRRLADDPSRIRDTAPLTWAYLARHAERLDRRKSSVYAKRPRFAMFGIGDYSFAPWKVAVSGFHKAIRFVVVGPCSGKPVMLDNGCYYIPCASADEAGFVARLLNTEPCHRFLNALAFFDAKRPLTKAILQRIDLTRLAALCQSEEQARRYFQ